MIISTNSNPPHVSNIDPSAIAVRAAFDEPDVRGASHNGLTGEIAETSDAKTQPRRILIVDDNEDSAEAMAMLLERFGFQVNVAFSGEAAIEQEKLGQFDVVLLDLSLPDMHGTTVAERLRSGGFSGKLIAVSGNSEPAMKERCSRAGMDQFLVKPCSGDVLRRLI